MCASTRFGLQGEGAAVTQYGLVESRQSAQGIPQIGVRLGALSGTKDPAEQLRRLAESARLDHEYAQRMDDFDVVGSMLQDLAIAPLRGVQITAVMLREGPFPQGVNRLPPSGLPFFQVLCVAGAPAFASKPSIAGVHDREAACPQAQIRSSA